MQFNGVTPDTTGENPDTKSRALTLGGILLRREEMLLKVVEIPLATK